MEGFYKLNDSVFPLSNTPSSSASFIITYEEPKDLFSFNVDNKIKKRSCNLILFGIMTFIFIVLIVYVLKKLFNIKVNI